MLKGHVLQCKRYAFICQRFVLYRFKYNGIYNVCCTFLLQCLCSCVDDTGEYIFKGTRHSSHCSLTCCRSARYSVMSCRSNSSHNMETADSVTSWKVNSSHRNALNVKLLHADVTSDEFL